MLSLIYDTHPRLFASLHIAQRIVKPSVTYGTSSTCTADKGSIPGPNPSHHVNKVDAAAQRWPYRDRSPI